jgi:hypothetical protein
VKVNAIILAAVFEVFFEREAAAVKGKIIPRNLLFAK